MDNFVFFATPWWVNLLILIPISIFLLSRKKGFLLTKKHLAIAAIFGFAFGFVEASVVVYLRAALGFLPGYMDNLSEAARLSLNIYQQTEALNNLPKSLFTVEIFREAATMMMLVTIAFLSAKKFKEKFAMLLWIFAAWDIFYYVGLWLTVRWPYSLTTPDVLFLIPVPWLSQVWFPLLVSILTMIVIGVRSTSKNQRT